MHGEGLQQVEAFRGEGGVRRHEDRLTTLPVTS